MKKFSTSGLGLLGLFAGIPAYSQGNESNLSTSLDQINSSQFSILILFAILLGLIILMLGLLFYMVSFFSSVLEGEVGEEILHQEKLTWWTRWKGRKVTDKDQAEYSGGGEILEEHSYDGIVELDNFMPSWLQYVFVLSIGFGIIYFVNYSVLGWGKTQMEEYQEELQLASREDEERKLTAVSVIDETNVEYDKTTASLESGKAIFGNNCVACHASDGGGGVGPNLTDAYWIHGGTIKAIFTVVKYGVPEKGMIPWQGQLSAEQMQQVSSYILTMAGSTPLNPKEPQGEKYEPAIEDPIDVLSGDELELQKVEEK